MTRGGPGRRRGPLRGCHELSCFRRSRPLATGDSRASCVIPLSSPRTPIRGPSMAPDAAAAGEEQAQPLKLPPVLRLDPGFKCHGAVFRSWLAARLLSVMPERPPSTGSGQALPSCPDAPPPSCPDLFRASISAAAMAPMEMPGTSPGMTRVGPGRRRGPLRGCHELSCFCHAALRKCHDVSWAHAAASCFSRASRCLCRSRHALNSGVSGRPTKTRSPTWHSISLPSSPSFIGMRPTRRSRSPSHSPNPGAAMLPFHTSPPHLRC